MNIEIAPKETEIQANWDDAKFYCFALNIDGKTGWRLPTKEELDEIYQSKNDFVDTYYWSSTDNDGADAWLQSMSHGTQCHGNKHYRNKYYGGFYVRAIRDLL